MAFDVVLLEMENGLVAGAEPASPDQRGESGRAVSTMRGEGSVFLADLPTSPKVFVFFYRGSADTDELEKHLQTLGQRTGENLFVNIGSTGDPDYNRACGLFEIGSLPVIVVTAISPLAATPGGETAFVRLDARSLMEKPDETIATVEQLFNLFLANKISEAITTAWTDQAIARLRAAAAQVWAVIHPVVAWIASRDIKLGFASAKIEIVQARSRQ